MLTCELHLYLDSTETVDLNIYFNCKFSKSLSYRPYSTKPSKVKANPNIRVTCVNDVNALTSEAGT